MKDRTRIIALSWLIHIMCSCGLYAQYATETIAGLSEVHVDGHTMYKAVINRVGGRTDIVVSYGKYRSYSDGELGEAAYWKLMHFSELKEVAALERSVLLDVFKILGEKRIDLINKKSKALSWLTIILDMDNDGKITNVELEMEPKLNALYINNYTAIKILRYLKEHYTIIPSYGNLKQYSYKGPMKYRIIATRKTSSIWIKSKIIDINRPHAIR